MKTKIVVVGAGYAGLVAAKLIAARTPSTVTLVNATDRFVERVRLHQLAAGQTLRDRPLRALLRGTGVRLVVDRAEKVDAATRVVHLAQGEPLNYDILVYALGSHVDTETVPGVAEHAHTVGSAPQAERLNDHLARGAGTVTVVGGGLTGLEAATEIAESHPRRDVRLVSTDSLGAELSQRGARHVRARFERLRIDTREHARVTEVRSTGLLLDDGSFLTSDTVVWTAGFRVPDLARQAGVETTPHGQVVVDETLRSVSHPEIYAVGDAAALVNQVGVRLRMACATGMPSGQHLARVIAARTAGLEAPLFGFRYVVRCVSLGRRDALIQFVREDDTPRERVLTGRAAVLTKEAIVRNAAGVMRYPWLPASL
ncbi:FAD-dependent oxidoreductase [Spiractinospora alimapuensis]|uniref:NAD(P)/FAD-dependent oxidoreductase n=1 Tax=Spiractinospora alimapuensis TaxID=2820884 RepID=UPI001F2526FF|nr:FAD-dependent oxidoreductase [Spiractinospora alimapuensis]QVQ52709.1 FAD-dependent oxidoreductase [Spiractinospora alimapuensis]